jgi:ribosomal protein S18 acetylase RimI-like enzyme
MLRLSLVGSSDETALLHLFQRMASDATANHFRPHSFSAVEARQVANDTSGDVAALLAKAEEPIGYGLLRGWAAGYSVPSLGIYIVPECRGAGYARCFMGYLAAVARHKGAKSVRLRVAPENHSAFHLYKKLGYQFDGSAERGQLVGMLALCHDPNSD